MSTIQKTVLRICQDLMYDLDSDEIDSIEDSPESIQIARKVENVYWDLVTRLKMKEFTTWYQLEPSIDTDTPAIMFMPDSALSLDSLEYNTSEDIDHPRFTPMKRLPLDKFLEMTRSFSVDSTTGYQGIASQNEIFSVPYKNNQMPKYYTTFDDDTLVFDAVKITVDDTLVGSKTKALGRVLPAFSLTDDFIPPLDEQFWPLFYQECKKSAFIDTKQMDNPDADNRARKQWIATQRADKVKIKPLDKLPNYGR